MPSTHLQNVIVVGAGGQIGGQIVKALIAEGRHKVTALTRPDSTSDMPQGLHAIRKANYNNQDELVTAMKGQDVLVITMNAMAPAESSIKLIDAAAVAGVKYIVPNEWGSDRDQVQLGKDLMLAEGQIKIAEHIVSKGIKWISIGCGFWYEFSLAGDEVRYGFDFNKKTVTLYDHGTTKITTTTWPQTALALARVLALPLTSSSGPSIVQLEDKQVLITSFYVSQRDMLDSILRVTGDKESDWTITHEGAKQRFDRGMQMLQQGNFEGFTVAMYSRAFVPDDPMNHEAKTVNTVLGLPKEDFDDATRVALSMARSAAA